MNRLLACLFVLVVLRLAHAETPPATTFAAGQKIEIREGDSWSAGTLIRKEGRKFLVHYEGTEAATDEWVTIDRLRAPGTATTGPAGKGATSTPVAEKPKAPVWNIGDKVQCKWGGLWNDAVITNKNGKWYLTTYDDGFREWVEPWRFRKRGSKEDTIEYASPHKMILPRSPITPPPTEDPSEAPVAHRGAFDEKRKAEADAAEKHAPVTPTDRTGIREIALGGAPASGLAPDAAKMPAPPLPSQPVILTGGSGGFFEKTEPLLFAITAPVAAVVHVDAPPGDPTVTRVERIDLRACAKLSAVKMPVNVVGCDLSPDGKQFLAHSTAFGFGMSDRLDLWNIAGAEPAHIVSFKPYDAEQNIARDITWGKFIDADHVATLNNEGHFIVWDTKGKALWATNISAYTTPALSPTGKYIALVAQEAIAIVEPLTGETLQMIEAGPLNRSHLSFRPDGTQIAASGADLLLIWDLASGQIKYDISPIGATGQSVYWAEEGFVLLDGKYLVGLEQGVIVRQYARQGRPDEAFGSYGGRFYYTDQPPTGGKATLASIVLPDAQAKANAAGMKLNELMAVKPGVKVSLEVSLPGNMNEKAMAALKAKLAANGVTVADGQPIRLVASTEQGKSHEMSYGDMMGPRFGPMARPVTKMNVNEVISKLAFIGADGKTLWQRQSVIQPPSFVRMKEGQSIDQAVAEAMTPQVGFFEQTRIPKFVPTGNTAATVGKLTARGTVSDK